MSSQLSSLLTQTIGTFSISTILSAAVTLLICLVVVRVLLKLTRKLLAGSKLDQRVQKYILAGIRLLLYIVTALIVADCLHINMTSLVALLSVGSLGITLAAEDILGNVAGGLVILSSHPFAIGDFVEVSGTSGTVDEISLNHTKLVTPDGLMVMLPNKELASSRMTNYTVLGRRRVTRKITASYDAPTQKVIDALVQAGTMDNVLLTPAPSACVSSYGDSAIAYTLRVWVKTEDYWDVYFALTQRVKDVFDEQGITMTYPHLNVHLDK